MYVPRFNAMDDSAQIRRLVAEVGSAELVTVRPDGFPTATLLPVMWEGDLLIFHLARANPQWVSIEPGSPALAIVAGPQAYVSAGWYASKTEHGRVVPTWNYVAAQFTGRVTVRREEEWLRNAVTRLTDLREQGRAEPWSIDDAPARYIDKQLHAIVGVEFIIETIEGKAKLSQNRSAIDQAGVIAGLREEGGAREHQVANAMIRP